MLKSLIDIRLVDIESVSSSEPRSNFSKKEIDDLANNLLRAGGNAKPILVKQIDFENLQVVLGHLEYYAAVRAREINDDFENISAIILNKDNEELVLKQYESLATASNVDKDLIADNSKAKASLDKRALASLEKNLLDHLKDQLEYEVNKLESGINKTLDEKFNNVKILVPNDQDHLAIFNHADLKELIQKLEPAGFTGKKGNKIAIAIIEERKRGLFSSFFEITERVRLDNQKKTRAVTAASMTKILDSWNGWLDLRKV